MPKSGRPKSVATEEGQTRMVCTRFSPVTLAKLEHMSKEQDRSISWLVRKAADEFVARHTAPKGKALGRRTHFNEDIAPRERTMDIREVVANVQRRKELEAVSNELELRAAKQKDVVFSELREELQQQLTVQIAYLAGKGIKLFLNEQGDQTHINRSDSGKTLTISFVALFHHCASTTSAAQWASVR